MRYFQRRFCITLSLFLPLCGSAAVLITGPSLVVKAYSGNGTFEDYLAGMEAAAEPFTAGNPGHPNCIQFSFREGGGSSFTPLAGIPSAGDADTDSDYFVTMETLPARFQLTSDAHFGSFNAPLPAGNRLITKVTSTGLPDEEHTLYAAGEGGTPGGDPLLLEQTNQPFLHFLHETPGPQLHGLDEGAPFHAMQKVDPSDGDAVDQYLLYLDIDATGGISSGDPMFYLSGANAVPVPEPAFTWLALSIGAVTMLAWQRRK